MLRNQKSKKRIGPLLLFLGLLLVVFGRLQHVHAKPVVEGATSTLPRDEDGLVPATLLPKSDAEWEKVLTPAQYKILRQKGTERAFTGKLNATKARGMYRCAACGQPLYSSEAKFDSGTGWPSFYQPITPKAIATADDSSFFSKRTEVLCARCGSHLGHVFDDGPEPTGLRYCMNSAALSFEPARP